MAANSVDNVVAFNEARAARPSMNAGKPDSAIYKRSVKPESLGVINDCRDLVLKRICAALATTFDKIEDELFELAGKSADRETQNMYLDARSQAREKRPDIEAAFRTQFLSFFGKKVAGAPPPATSKDRFDKDQLSLVEDDTLTENIAVADITNRLADKCDEELRALSQRMGFLLAEPELADDANPIAPDTVVRALKAACDQMTAGFQTRLTILRMVEQHMAQEMVSVYHDVNAHLVAQQVMPTLRPTFRRAQAHGRRAPSNSTSGPANPSSASAHLEQDMSQGYGPAAKVSGEAAQHFGGYSTAGLGMPPATQATELFETLQRLMSGTHSASYSEASANRYAEAQEYSSFTTGGFAPVPPRSPAESAPRVVDGTSHSDAGRGQKVGAAPAPLADTNNLIRSLSEIQLQWLNATNPSAAMAAIQNFVPGQSNATELNLLREIRSQGVTETASQVDAMTIDIVAMLFDFVFDDKAIPDTIKALIARLQIPVLKVAILDKSFFSRKTHPVRRLLDVLADASVAFPGEASREDPLYKKIETIVDRVHGEFDTDVAIFNAMVHEFEAFLKAREVANAEVIEQSARAMHDREKREMARLIAQAEVDRHISEGDLPPPVVAMLKGPWSQLLERIYLRDSGRSARFIEANDTAEQLVWSVHPKVDADQRRDLITALPILLRRLQEGLDIATVDQEERKRFFSALVDCHAAAVKAGLRGESVASLFSMSHNDHQVVPLFEKLIAEERARAETAESSRTGIARIQLTDHGVEIEEVNPALDGHEVGVAPISASIVAAEQSASGDGQFEFSTESTFDLKPEPAIPPPALKRGTWVEFVRAGGVRIRAKLSWISPLKGVYLFTNPGATEALSIAPDALHRELEKGRARVIEESSLMDRAVDRMVTSLGNAAS
jgi:hypothetical protein